MLRQIKDIGLQGRCVDAVIRVDTRIRAANGWRGVASERAVKVGDQVSQTMLEYALLLGYPGVRTFPTWLNNYRGIREPAWSFLFEELSSIFVNIALEERFDGFALRIIDRQYPRGGEHLYPLCGELIERLGVSIFMIDRGRLELVRPEWN